MPRLSRILLPLLALALATPSRAAAGTSAPDPAPNKEGHAMAFTIQSPAFHAGAAIPTQHTCDDVDRSPRLEWSEPPAGTRSLALVVDDPDAPVGDWVHWVIYGLPATLRALPEGIGAEGTLKDPPGAKQGRNDFGRLGWGGPCPPPGKPHRYFFKLYALDAPLDLAPGATKAAVERAMKGHILAQAEIFGTYARRR